MKFLFALATGIMTLACTATVGPRIAPMPTAEEAEGRFAHRDFDTFLSRHVDENGWVDYSAAVTDRADLDRYIADLAAASPDSQPDRFSTEAERLAYWINAYNASAIALVLNRYPISSVRDVRPPWAFFFLPRLSGFFLFQRVILGGKRTSLYSLENGLIRKRFAEPRVHFALNCASISCPRLPPEAFTGERLGAQLERETRRFMAEARNVRFDSVDSALHLSSIFRWYRDDFTNWLRDRRPDVDASLAQYVLLYADADEGLATGDRSEWQVEFVPYDWGLNDQVEAMH